MYGSGSSEISNSLLIRSHVRTKNGLKSTDTKNCYVANIKCNKMLVINFALLWKKLDWIIAV